MKEIRRRTRVIRIFLDEASMSSADQGADGRDPREPDRSHPLHQHESAQRAQGGRTHEVGLGGVTLAAELWKAGFATFPQPPQLRRRQSLSPFYRTSRRQLAIRECPSVFIASNPGGGLTSTAIKNCLCIGVRT